MHTASEPLGPLAYGIGSAQRWIAVAAARGSGDARSSVALPGAAAGTGCSDTAQQPSWYPETCASQYPPAAQALGAFSVQQQTLLNPVSMVWQAKASRPTGISSAIEQRAMSNCLLALWIAVQITTC